MAKCPECKSKIPKRYILHRFGNKPFLCKTCGVCLRIKVEDMTMQMVLLYAPAVLITMLYSLSGYKPEFIVLLFVWLIIGLSQYIKFVKVIKVDADKCEKQ